MKMMFGFRALRRGIAERQPGKAERAAPAAADLRKDRLVTSGFIPPSSSLSFTA
jgi:hypothetical protein